MPNLYIRNLKGAWKKLVHGFDTPDTYGTLMDYEPSEEMTEKIEQGDHIYIVKKNDAYILIYGDKDNDYQRRKIHDEKIIHALNEYNLNNNAIYFETNEIDPELTKDINHLLLTLNSNSFINKVNRFEPLPIGFAKCLFFCVGLVCLPVIAGAKTLFDLATRHPIPENKVEPVIHKIQQMDEHKFRSLSKHIIQKYRQTCTTSNSSRKIIKELNDHHSLQDIHQKQSDLIDYMSDVKNNGKKLFCTVAALIQKDARSAKKHVRKHHYHGF